MKNNIEHIKQLFHNQGLLNYGENITQTEHAVQCWQIAKESKANLNLRVAAFLHDVGHLLYAEIEVKNSDDMKHEELGAKYLQNLGFPDEIVQLVLSHVWAKRYLITQDEKYLDGLSEASKLSFIHQGGKLSIDEMNFYKNEKNLKNCLLLRKWDDLGKNELASNVIPDEVWFDIESCIK